MKKKTILKVISFVLVIFLILIASKILPLYNNNRILKGVTVCDIDIGGMTRDEAINQIIDKKNFTIDEFSVTFNYDGKKIVYRFKDLDFDYNHAAEKAADLAMQYGHSGSIIDRINAMKNISKEYNTIECNLVYDDKSIQYIIDDVCQGIFIPKYENIFISRQDDLFLYGISDETALQYLPQRKINDSKWQFEFETYMDSLFHYRTEVTEFYIDTESLFNSIINDLSHDNIANVDIEVLVRKISFDLDQMKKQTTLVYQSKSGISHTSFYARDKNIEAALNYFGGYTQLPGTTLSFNPTTGNILYPGETMSFNTITKEPTIENGYFLYPGISQDGPPKPNLSQAATIMLNAAIMSGCDIIERHGHAWPLYTADDDYGQDGLDAYVEWGEKDLIFANNTKYPIYFDTYVHWESMDSIDYAYCNVFTMPLPDNQEYVIESIPDFIGETPEIVYEEVESIYSFEGGSWKEDEELNKMVFEYMRSMPRREYSIYRITVDKDGNEIEREKLYDAIYEEIQGKIYIAPIPEE